MAQVIYARVPDALKDDLDEYAEKQGVTLTSAAVDLLHRGLAAASEERSIASLEARLARTAVEKAETEASLKGAMGELNALRAFAVRASQTKVGKCPSCGHEITGLDLLGTGSCKDCKQSLLSLLAPRASASSLDEREFGLLVGALGIALVGVAVLGSKGR